MDHLANLIEIIDEYIVDKNRDQHCLVGSMLYSLDCRKIISIVDKKKLINAYFCKNKEVYDIVKSYVPSRLFKFLHRISKII
jgi:hypothetical protein